MPIRYGNYYFTDPTPLVKFSPPRRQGIYIMQMYSTYWGPKRFQPLYIGECMNFADRVKYTHERFVDCIRAAQEGLIYVSIMPTDGLTSLQRKAIETSLIREYNPTCNIQKKRTLLPPI